MSTVSFVEVFRFVWRYWKQVPYKFFVMMVGLLFGMLFEVQVPAAAAALVRTVEEVFAGGAEMTAAWSAMWFLVTMIGLMFLVTQIKLRVWMYLASEVMQKMVHDGFFNVQRFSSDWHANNFSGSTVRKITRGMWAYDSFADTVVVELGPAIAVLVGFSVAMYLREPMLGLYFAGAITLFLGISIWVSLSYVAPANVRSNDADTEMGGALADAVTCNATIKAFGAEAREDALFATVSQKWRLRARTAWLRSMDAGALQSLLLLLLLGGLLSVVLMLMERGDSKLEDVVYVVTTYFIINGYLRNIGWQVRNLQRSVNELDDLVSVAKTVPQVANQPGAVPFQAGPGFIQYDNIGFKYENQPKSIYDGLTVTIAAGEKVALVGESGSGKTTFVKLLQRLYDLDSGRILVDGQNIAQVTQESLRERVALVPQEPILFHRTLAENIAYAKPSATHDEIVTAARKAHAHEFIERLEQGYDTLVGERGIKLSGGERQRVAIARAILADCPILILDEATSSLDSVTESLIQDGISNLMEGRTAILVAHRLSTIRSVDRILVFSAGEIVESGSHRELMANASGHYRRMYDMQVLGFFDSEDDNDAEMDGAGAVPTGAG